MSVNNTNNNLPVRFIHTDSSEMGNCPDFRYGSAKAFWTWCLQCSTTQIEVVLKKTGSKLFYKLNAYINHSKFNPSDAAIILNSLIRCLANLKEKESVLVLGLFESLYKNFIKFLKSDDGFSRKQIGDSHWETLILFYYESREYAAAISLSKCCTLMNPVIFSLAIKLRNWELIDRCLLYYTSPYHVLLPNGDTPIHAALKLHLLELVKYLLEKGVDPNQKDRNGVSPLNLLAKCSPIIDETFIEVLIKYGANPYLPDQSGLSYLQILLMSDNSNSNKNIANNLLKLMSFVHEPLPESNRVAFNNFPSYENSPILRESQRLLTSSGFITDTNDTQHKYGLVGNVQGCREMRRLACKLSPEVFSPAVLTQHRQINPKLYVAFLIKRFAHALGLKNNPLCSNLEGFSEAFTKSMIAASIKSFSPLKDFSLDDCEWVYEKLKNASFADAMEDLDYVELSKKVQLQNYDDALLLGCGFDWHFFSGILIGHYILFFNRGRDSSLQNEICIYLIPNILDLTPEYLKGLINRYSFTSENYTSQAKMVNDLHLVKIYSQNLKQQKAGYCTYANTKAGIYGLITIRLLIKNCNSISKKFLSDSFIWKNAFSAGRAVYKLLTAHDRQEAIIPVLVEVDHMLNKSEEVSTETKLAFYHLLLSACAKLTADKIALDSNILVRRISQAYRLAILERTFKLGSYFNTTKFII